MQPVIGCIMVGSNFDAIFCTINGWQYLLYDFYFVSSIIVSNFVKTICFGFVIWSM